MSSQEPRLSQDYNLMQPKILDAFAVTISEWNSIKEKIDDLDSDPFWLNSIGSCVLGIGLTLLINLLLTHSVERYAENEKPIVIAVGAVCVVLSIGVLWISREQRFLMRERASDLIVQMDLIEDRFIKTQSHPP